MKAIDLKAEEKKRLIEGIQDFFYEERNEEIGIIAAEKALDFFLSGVGKLIYNKALDESKIWFYRRLEDISLDYELLYK